MPIGSGPAHELILEVGCCSVLLQCVVAVRCSVLQHVADDARVVRPGTSADFGGGLLQCVAVCCCSVLLQCVAVCCNVSQVRSSSVVARHKFGLCRWVVAECVAVGCCSALQCVAVCCSVLQMRSSSTSHVCHESRKFSCMSHGQYIFVLHISKELTHFVCVL